MLNRLRRRLDDAIRRRVEPRLSEADARLGEALERIDRAQQDYEARLKGTQADFSYIRSEFDRIAPQVSALEQRLERLRLQLNLPEQNPDDSLVRARLEHERARLRLELAAHYEERLRRLETNGD